MYGSGICRGLPIVTSYGVPKAILYLLNISILDDMIVVLQLKYSMIHCKVTFPVPFFHLLKC